MVQPICQHSPLPYGTPVSCSNRVLWIQAVRDHFDDVPLFVSGRKLLQLVCETAPQAGCDVYLVDPDGCHQSGDLVALCRGSAPFPGSGVHVFVQISTVSPFMALQ